jgi:hypothetical protein
MGTRRPCRDAAPRVVTDAVERDVHVLHDHSARRGPRPAGLASHFPSDRHSDGEPVGVMKVSPNSASPAHVRYA